MLILREIRLRRDISNMESKPHGAPLEGEPKGEPIGMTSCMVETRGRSLSHRNTDTLRVGEVSNVVFNGPTKQPANVTLVCDSALSQGEETPSKTLFPEQLLHDGFEGLSKLDMNSIPHCCAASCKIAEVASLPNVTIIPGQCRLLTT
jgi:hypothetical protein